jgi:Ni/Co efflux regulator RcnB
MKTMTMRSSFFSPLHAKVLVALIAACGVAGISMMPAHAESNDKRDEHQDKGNHKDEGHGDREHGDRERGDRDRRGHDGPGYYPQPVYAPPAVYYPPQQSPGLSLFVPLDIHIR